MNPDKHQLALHRNDRLHWYEIKSILGQGGFGITYLARDTNLDHDVAIKEFLPRQFATRDSRGHVQPVSGEHEGVFEWGRSRFLDEARTLVQFKHHNIVRVLSFFEDNNTGYMVMEFEDGEDFIDLIQRGMTFDEKRLLEIVLPILDGLALVHDQGFIHRDIKPRNIVIRKDGSPVLIDFGSARQAMGVETRTLTALFTPGYSPLEQYHEKAGKQGPWTDIYALAASLYTAIAGQTPADALKRSASRADDKPDIYQKLGELGLVGYSEHFLAAIDHALEFVPRNRPRNVAEWSGMLRGAIPVPRSDATTRVYLGPADPDKVVPVPETTLPNYPESGETLPSSIKTEETPSSSNTRAAVEKKREPIAVVFLGILAALLIGAYWIDDQQNQPDRPVVETGQVGQQPADGDSVAIDPGFEVASPKQDAPGPETAGPAVPVQENPSLAVLPLAKTDSSGKRNSRIDRSVNLSGAYSSELSDIGNDSGFDANWFFGEQSGMRIHFEHAGKQISGLIEGSREGRIEGRLSGNEILFNFYVIDPDGNTHQGSGSWFVSRDGKKMVGRWALVKVTDGSVSIEGDWKLTRLE